jgi:tetratricopeptide (TPR) repeat protein
MQAGLSLLQAGKYEAAWYFFSNYRNARSSRLHGVFKFLGLACLGMEKWEMAAEQFQKARSFQPEDPGAWLGQGTAMGLAGKNYLAIQVLEALLEHHPDYAPAHIQIAVFYRDAGEMVLMSSHLEKASLARQWQERRLAQEALKGTLTQSAFVLHQIQMAHA